ncbi:hypothetical protein V2J09_021230 [Rumex salicifolius]
MRFPTVQIGHQPIPPPSLLLDPPRTTATTTTITHVAGLLCRRLILCCFCESRVSRSERSRKIAITSPISRSERSPLQAQFLLGLPCSFFFFSNSARDLKPAYAPPPPVQAPASRKQQRAEYVVVVDESVDNPYTESSNTMSFGGKVSNPWGAGAGASPVNTVAEIGDE